MALTILLNSLVLKNNTSYAGAVWFMNLSRDSQFVQNSGKKIFGCNYFRYEKSMILLSVQDKILIYVF